MHLISVLVYVLIMTRKCSDNVQLILRSFYVLFGILISARDECDGLFSGWTLPGPVCVRYVMIVWNDNYV